MADGDCTWSGPFICEDESVEKRPPLPESDYVKAPGNLGYYKKYKELKNFQDAMRACQADGSHLVIINNNVEERVMMKIAGKGSHWVGVHDSYNEGNYVTVFSKYCVINTRFLESKICNPLAYLADMLKKLRGPGQLYLANVKIVLM